MAAPNSGSRLRCDVLGQGVALADSLLSDRFTNQVSVKLMLHASRLDLTAFEDPVFYDKLERARRQTTGRISLVSSLLGICQDFVTLVSLSGALILFSPWLFLLLPAAVLPSFLGETRFASLAYSMLYSWTPQRRELDYLRLLGASNQSAKEVKIFRTGRVFCRALSPHFRPLLCRKQDARLPPRRCGSTFEFSWNWRILRGLRVHFAAHRCRDNQRRQLDVPGRIVLALANL